MVILKPGEGVLGSVMLLVFALKVKAGQFSPVGVGGLAVMQATSGD